MLGTYSGCLLSRYGAVSDQPNVSRSISYSIGSCSSRFSIRLDFRTKSVLGSKFPLISCKSSRGSIGANGHGSDYEFLEATLLPETILHYRMRKQRFREDVKLMYSGQLPPLTVSSTLSLEFLRRFQNPTIFLKISCDGDFVLPVIVGESAMEKLVDAPMEDLVKQNFPDLFQLLRNFADNFGYEVTMVRITERVANTYLAKLYFGKIGKNDVKSVDIRPSDAVNVANRFKVPIYVSKQIVFTDAIAIGYGISRVLNAKSIYDVYLDSAMDGRDLVGEELKLMINMNAAIKEERYKDAVMWRDKLNELRQPRDQE